jgi:excisionase family DNA binding protein
MKPHNVIPLDRRAHFNTPQRTDRAVYTVREVAHLLDLSLGSTYNLLRLGEIPAKHLGGRWVIPKQRFHAWLDGEFSEEIRIQFEKGNH